MSARHRFGVLVIVGLGLVTTAPPALAASGALDAARAAYRELDYPRVLPLVEQALLEPLTEEDRVAAYELRAFVHAIEGDTNASRQAFREILAIHPRYDLPPTASPKLRAPLEAARAETAASSEPPVLSIPAPPAPDNGAFDVRQSAPPIYRRPLFWVGVAVVAAAATAVAIIVARDGTPDHDFGPYTIHAVGRPVATW